jgi:hypothetical protein
MERNGTTTHTISALLLCGAALLLASCAGSGMTADTDWFEASVKGKGPHYTANHDGENWEGDPIGFDYILLDPGDILRGRKMPGLANFRLLPTGCEGDVYVHDAPKEGIRVVLVDCQVLKTNGTVVHRFPVPPGREKVWKAKARSWIRPIVWKSDAKPLDTPPQGDVIVLVTLRIQKTK